MSGKKPSEENKYGGLWSKNKLDCVESYLEAYLTAMTNQNFDLWYIDAFSGDGIQKFNRQAAPSERIIEESNKDIESFVLGSALRALNVSERREASNKKAFNHFVFIEFDRDKLSNLKQRIKNNYPNQFRKCNFIEGDVNVHLPAILRRIPWSRAGRGVCFIDPWATQLKWKTLEAFSETCCDGWLLFPVESISRLMPRNKLPPESWCERLNEIFGDNNWVDIYSTHGSQMMLFDEEEEIITRKQGCEALLCYTEKRLRSLFAGVSKPAYLKRDDGVPKFVLYAFVPNSSEKAINLALKIANHLVGRLNRDVS